MLSWAIVKVIAAVAAAAGVGIGFLLRRRRRVWIGVEPTASRRMPPREAKSELAGDDTTGGYREEDNQDDGRKVPAR
ncbi:MAG TPA: hypothetical protein VFX98_11400 [Longimicrobiaceae bacterium]|nr:hypothetical protein [Longimicrobiaceae bacterium]